MAAKVRAVWRWIRAAALLFAACTDGAVSFDLEKGGTAVGRIQTGGGVDNLDFHAGKGTLYVAAAVDGTVEGRSPAAPVTIQ